MHNTYYGNIYIYIIYYGSIDPLITAVYLHILGIFVWYLCVSMSCIFTTRAQ